MTRGWGGCRVGGCGVYSFNGRVVTVCSYDRSGVSGRAAVPLPLFTILRAFIGAAAMNEDKIKGQWKQLAGRGKAKWGNSRR